MDTEAAARRWAREWAAAWVAADADRVEALYVPGAPFRSHPFRDVQTAGAYARWSFGEQESAECWFGEPLVDGDRAAVEYWGVVRGAGGDETIAGVSLLRFRDDGLVTEQHDYWAGAEGRRDRDDGFGR
jgi:hypothetical protein